MYVWLIKKTNNRNIQPSIIIACIVWMLRLNASNVWYWLRSRFQRSTKTKCTEQNFLKINGEKKFGKIKMVTRDETALVKLDQTEENLFEFDALLHLSLLTFCMYYSFWVISNQIYFIAPSMTIPFVRIPQILFTSFKHVDCWVSVPQFVIKI